MQGVPSVDKEEERGKGGAPHEGKGTARGMEEEFVGGVEEEGRVVLWTNSATRCTVMGVGVAWPRSRGHVRGLPKMWQRRMLRGRRSGARNAPLLEEGENKLVWMQGEESGEWRASKRLEKRSKSRESDAAQRGRGAAEQHTVRRTGKRSKREG